MSGKTQFIATLRECAALMEINGENPFRCRAYENAARALEGLQGEPADWLASDVLAGVKGIGKGMIEHIEEWAKTGELKTHEELKARLPTGLLDMYAIPGLGAKKVKALWEKLGVDSLEKLEKAAAGEAVASLPGFGRKTADKILAGIEQRRRFSGRHRLDVGLAIAEDVLARLRRLKAVRRIELAGSLRRRRETFKDLDFVVESRDPAAVMEAFISTPGVLRVVSHGPTKSSVLFEGGVPADVRVVGPDQFAAALNYFTGSKEHNIQLRARALKRGLRLNEYGLFPEGKERSLPCPDEAAIYRHLGLAYIEPELREDMGEIEAAQKGDLPNLIRTEDLRGLLHCHTTYSDGKSTLAQMAEAAAGAGYAYFGVCDHSRSAAYAGGLAEADVARQHREIDALARKLKTPVLLKGIEADIGADGSLDYSDAVLARFDFVVVSIHSRFQLSREEMTRRVCRALAHPASTILGHPTGRLLLEREPYELNLEKVFVEAARRRVAIEINANPHRLDLDWRFMRQAKAAGCLFAINPDAHHTSGIADNAFGVGVARKGWLEADDVINTWTPARFRRWLKARGQPHA